MIFPCKRFVVLDVAQCVFTVLFRDYFKPRQTLGLWRHTTKTQLKRCRVNVASFSGLASFFAESGNDSLVLGASLESYPD